MGAKADEAFPALSTERLRLRRVELRDASGLHACFGDPVAMRYWDIPRCRTVADTERVVRWLAKTTSPHDHLAWAITEGSADACIGMVCYHHREARNKRLELGYIVAPEHQRRGLGTEAVRAVLVYCAGKLGVHRVQALVHPENAASIRLVERLGFRCEGGPLTDYWRVGDSYRSAMLYAFVTTPDGGSPSDPLQAARARKTRQRGP
jgi:RimJ/RimL family protein N-acetyltransferase